MSTKRLLLAASLVMATSTTTSCTITKPFVCAVTTPAYVLGSATNGCGCGDPRGVVCAIGFVALFGAAAGLVTGIISDVNVLLGNVDDPARNIHHPFLTNTSDDG